MNKKHQNITIYQTIFVFMIAGLFIVPVSANIFGGFEKQMKLETNERGGTIYVNDDNVDGPWDGTIDYPYQFIQEGVDYASDGDTVFVFKGMYEENVVISKAIQLIGEDRDLTYLSAFGFGTAIKIIAENVTVSGLSISHCGSNSNNAGIMVHTPNNIITNTNIKYNDNYGIYILAANNLIYHNNFIENTFQAFDVISDSTWDAGYPTGGNYWSDYEGTDSNEDGIGETPYTIANSAMDSFPLIHPYGSVYNSNTGEIFLTIQAAISDVNTLDGQTIITRSGTYWEHLLITKSVTLSGGSIHDHVIDGGESGDVVTITADNVTLQGFMIQNSGAGEQNTGVSIDGDFCTIKETIIYKNFQGIVLKSSVKNAMIVNNEITQNNWNGIVLKPSCQGVTIIENTISNNFYAGIGISDASNNFIYHNTFKANRHQAYDNAFNIWDNGYPSGGNYWSDYTGTDEDGDGIGDVPYAILDGINTDRYPLMGPFTPEDTVPPVVTIQSPSTGVYFWGLHLFSGLFKKSTIIYGPITIDVEATDAGSGIERVEFLIDDSINPQFTDTQPPYTWEWNQPYLFMRKHNIIVIAYDNAGNPNYDQLVVKKYL